MGQFSQLVTNGNFVLDDYWTMVNGAAIANGVLSLVVTAGSNANARQDIGFVSGQKYRLTATVNGPNTRQIKFRDAASTNGGLPGADLTNGRVTCNGSDQNIEFVFTANDNSNLLLIGRQSTGDYTATIDNVRVQKLSPFNDIIKPADVPTTIFNNPIRTFSGEEPCLV